MQRRFHDRVGCSGSRGHKGSLNSEVARSAEYSSKVRSGAPNDTSIVITRRNSTTSKLHVGVRMCRKQPRTAKYLGEGGDSGQRAKREHVVHVYLFSL